MAPRLLPLAVVVLVLTAGCSGGTSGSPSNATDTTTATPVPTTDQPTPPTAQWTEPDGPHEYPDPPENLTAGSAAMAAMAYEEVYVENRLAAKDLDHYNAGALNADIDRWADGGVYVVVEIEYSSKREYGDGTAMAQELSHGRATATYFVSAETVRRVRGSTIST